jgi:hypothetical protein
MRRRGGHDSVASASSSVPQTRTHVQCQQTAACTEFLALPHTHRSTNNFLRKLMLPRTKINGNSSLKFTGTSQNKTSQTMYIQRKSEARSRNHWCRTKGKGITHSESVSVALVIQHEERMRRTCCFLWPVCLSVPLSLKGQDFRGGGGGGLLNLKCVFRISVELLSVGEILS